MVCGQIKSHILTHSGNSEIWGCGPCLHNLLLVTFVHIIAEDYKAADYYAAGAVVQEGNNTLVTLQINWKQMFMSCILQIG